MQFRLDPARAADSASPAPAVPPFDEAFREPIPPLSPENEAAADRALLGAFRRGDDVAFSLVYGRFRSLVTARVRTRVANAQAVEELVQEIFLKAFRYRESYDSRLPFGAWLKAIATNHVADWLRAQKLRHGLAAEFGSGTEGEVEAIADPGPCAEARLIQKSRADELARVCAGLTWRQRRVFVLRVVHHLSYEEIAGRLQISLSAVKCTMYRIRRELRGWDDEILAPA